MDDRPRFTHPADLEALGRGVYDAAQSLRLVNFERDPQAGHHKVSRSTLARWLRGYAFASDGEKHSSPPLWHPDYEDAPILQVSFRDLVELRFVKAFRDFGLSLPTIRRCFEKAVEEVGDPRPFSTRRFRTDGKTIFLEITNTVAEGQLIDLRNRQSAFRTVLAPSLKDFAFDGDIVSHWFPMGRRESTVVVDPQRAFGRPVIETGGIPTETLVDAVTTDGPAERVAELYEVPVRAVRDAVAFERKLAA